MKKKPIKQTTMLNFKGFLYLVAFGIWVFVLMNMSEEITSIQDAAYSYGGSALVIMCLVYIVIILLEFFVDIKDLD